MRMVDGLLNAAEDAPPGSVVEVVARQLLKTMGATEVAFLIADFSGDRLVPITRVSVSEAHEVQHRSEFIPIDDSHAGVALRRQRTQVVPDDNSFLISAPVTSRGDAIGVLELRLDERPAQAVVEEINETAHALAYIVIANRRHTDLFEWGQRRGSMTLAAEIQRRLIPGPTTCEAGSFTLAGWLEPSRDAAGDTFDYSFDETSLSLSITDAMGHSTDSALLATVALAALRNGRQAGTTLQGRAACANEALLDNSNDDQYVTGLLVNISLTGESATIVNAGHPLPFLERDGEVSVVPLEIDLPFGMFRDATYRLQKLDLQPGDRLLLVTDGLLERNADGFDIQGAIGELADAHGRELVRELCRKVTTAAGGELQDDATVLCLDWYGSKGEDRHSTSGSDDVTLV